MVTITEFSSQISLNIAKEVIGVYELDKSTYLEDNLQWKTTFGGRRLSGEDNLWWKTTFIGRRPLVEDDLWWKTTFGGGQPLVEDNLGWRRTFGGRRPLVEDDLQLILACCLIRFVAFLQFLLFSIQYLSENIYL